MSFVFVSGNLALDFIGTLKWRRSEPEEFIAHPEDVKAWALAAGVISVPFDVSDNEVEGLINFRESLYRLVAADLAGQPGSAADLATLNSKLRERTPLLQVVSGGLVKTGDVANLEASVASAAAELLTRIDKDRLKECGRENCTRVFIDRSRSGTRTWCGMDECGNRVKAANYRTRRKAKTG